jgi:hypothetical protein
MWDWESIRKEMTVTWSIQFPRICPEDLRNITELSYNMHCHGQDSNLTLTNISLEHYLYRNLSILSFYSSCYYYSTLIHHGPLRCVIALISQDSIKSAVHNFENYP